NDGHRPIYWSCLGGNIYFWANRLSSISINSPIHCDGCLFGIVGQRYRRSRQRQAPTFRGFAPQAQRTLSQRGAVLAPGASLFGTCVKLRENWQQGRWQKVHRRVGEVGQESGRVRSPLVECPQMVSVTR